MPCRAAPPSGFSGLLVTALRLLAPPEACSLTPLRWPSGPLAVMRIDRRGSALRQEPATRALRWRGPAAVGTGVQRTVNPATTPSPASFKDCLFRVVMADTKQVVLEAKTTETPSFCHFFNRNSRFFLLENYRRTNKVAMRISVGDPCLPITLARTDGKARRRPLTS